MFALARLLDKVPDEKLDMKNWVSKYGEAVFPQKAIVRLNECGYAACGCGWAVTIPSIAKLTYKSPCNVPKVFGFPSHADNLGTSEDAYRLFGCKRKVTPKELAQDIRHYLKTGELPAHIL